MNSHSAKFQVISVNKKMGYPNIGGIFFDTPDTAKYNDITEIESSKYYHGSKLMQ